ncbi:MAG: hypothetical protein E3K36_17065 [Candidatus Brocadia sp.]|nr:hypothetical protein [Candidatus Brocadia sp.]
MLRNFAVKTFNPPSPGSQSGVGEEDLQSADTHYTIHTTVNSALRDLRINAFLTFVGINLRFVIGNIINALIFFNILQSGNPAHRYDIHAPSIPDMCGDVVMIFVFAAAYLFIASNRVKNGVTGLQNLHKLGSQYFVAVKHLKNHMYSSKNLFSLTTIGFSLYFLSRYFLSPGLEVIFIENITPLSRVLNMVNDMIKLGNPLIFAYVYCKYLSANKSVVSMLYLFFIARNLFSTNMLGLIINYDLHVGAPFLDVLSPLIILCSVVSIVRGYKTETDLRQIGKSDAIRLHYNRVILASIPASAPNPGAALLRAERGSLK